MKIISFIKWAVIACCAMMFIGFFGSAFYHSPPATTADSAAWASALGTVGALIGTIVLAWIAGQRKRDSDLALATIAVAAIWIKVDRITQAVQNEIVFFETPPKGDANYNHVRAGDLRYVIKSIWTDLEILPLMAVASVVPVHLAASRSTLQHCITLMDEAVGEAESISGLPVASRILILEDLRKALADLRGAQKRMHDFMPSLRSQG